MILAQAATQTSPTAPLWVVPAVAAAGVIGGSLLSLLSTFLSDRRKRNYEDHRRWDNDIRVLCSELLVAARSMKDTLKSARELDAIVKDASRKPIAGMTQEERDELDRNLKQYAVSIERLAEQSEQVDLKHYELLLIAPKAVTDAAGLLSTAAISFKPDLDDDAWETAAAEFNHYHALLVVVTQYALSDKGFIPRRLVNGKLTEKLARKKDGGRQ